MRIPPGIFRSSRYVEFGSTCGSAGKPLSHKQFAALCRGTCLCGTFPASVTVADPLPNSGPRTCIGYSSKPVGSARSAPRELRNRCRPGLIDSKMESADELHLLHLADSGCATVRMSPAEVDEALQPAAAKPRA